MRLSLIFLLLMISHAAVANGNDALVSESDKTLINTNSLHDQMSIRSRYLPGGQFYLSGFINSFGEEDPLNTKDQMIFCNDTEVDFTSVIVGLISEEDAPEDGLIPYDSASFGVDQNEFVSAMESALRNNATPNARGRFCVPRFDPNVSFRNGNIDDVVCEEGEQVSFTDPSSGFSCTVTLDTDIKAGTYRFLRSESLSPPSVGLGYTLCEKERAGEAKLVLIDNPSSCATAPATCVNTCTWVGNRICRGAELPRWGGNRCGGQGTQSILGDTITVDSVDSFSIDLSTGTLYRGTAQFACEQVGNDPEWRVLSESCSVVN